MAVIRRSRGAGGGGAMVTILAAACSLFSCSFFEEDVYPGWLDYAAAKTDLRTAAADAGIGEARGIERLERIYYNDSNGAGNSLACVFVHGDTGGALLALDGTTLTVRKAWRRGSMPVLDALGPPIGATATGFACGNLAFNPDRLDEEPLIISAGAPPADALLFSDTETRRNYYARIESVTPNPPALIIALYDEHYVFIENSPPRPADATGSWLRILDADRLSGKLRILVDTDNGAYALGFTDKASLFASTPLLEDTTAERTGPFWPSDGKAWLTSDGVVAYRRDDRSRLELYPYGYSPSATADATVPTVEALELDTDGIAMIGFEPRGDYWYLYERLSGRLYALRTWWP